MRATLAALALGVGITAAEPSHTDTATEAHPKPTPGWSAYYDIDNPKDNFQHNDVDCWVTCDSKLVDNGQECRDYMARVNIDDDGNAVAAQCITIINGDVVDYTEAGQEKAVQCRPCLNYRECEEHGGPYLKNCAALEAPTRR